MSLVRLHAVLLLTVLALGGCPASQGPQLKVLGVEQSERSARRQIKLFVEVTNYARRPMRLQRLQYTFSPSGAHGEVALSRTVEAGSAIVLEVPIFVEHGLLGDELRGQLITEQDQIIRAFPVTVDTSVEAD